MALAVAFVAITLSALAWWAYRAPKAVLFSDLAERDAAVLTAELDKLKQPYSLSQDGKAILVAAESVHRVRLALMGKPLPLHGAVGFELFNSVDFGTSDFVQKINYQRALQGELTRTILSLEQVQDARLHLALPEQTPFRKDATKAKASVTVSVKPGQQLTLEQVVGIQRLISASVPDIQADAVTVLNQHGVVLSRKSDDEAGPSLAQLDARQALEVHLSSKATRLLEQAFRPGEASIAVDVVLNHEQSRVTTEEVVPAASTDADTRPTGVLTRERTATREGGVDRGEPNGASVPAQVLSQEMDYQVGKRIAQTAEPGGRIARLNVAVVIRRALSDSQVARVRELVGASVGLQPARGDSLVVQSSSELNSQPAPEGVGSPSNALQDSAQRQQGAMANADDVRRGAEGGSDSASGSRGIHFGVQRFGGSGLIVGALILLAAVTAVAWRIATQAKRHRQDGTQRDGTLTSDQRDALLVSIKEWLGSKP